MDWKSLALWLADCHAATTEYDGNLRSTSAARRRRLQDICAKTHAAIATGMLNAHPRDEASVLERLRKNSPQRNVP